MIKTDSKLKVDSNADSVLKEDEKSGNIDLARAQEIAGQLIMIRMPGLTLTEEMADFLRVHHIRAVCLFRQNMQDHTQLAKLTADLRQVMGPQSLIAIDQEGGAVVRATWVPQPPAAMSLGASDDAGLCRDVGAAVARSLKNLGFNWNFAPVLDVNNNVNNPVIAERSFGADPRKVHALAQAWMAGSLSEGIACCVKHFPGHGDTHIDSHRDLPEVNKSRAELDDLELAPFHAASKNSPAMMTAHIVYPQIDPGNPATLSKKILTGILREEWQYQGVVITDGMDMHAIAGRYGVGLAAVRALDAGADMVMALGTPETQLETLDALSYAIVKGDVSLEECHAKLNRIKQLVCDYPCQPSEYLAAQEASDRILMQHAWQRGLTAYHNPQAPQLGSQVRLVIRANVVSDGVSESGIRYEKIVAMLSTMYDVAVTTFDDADQFEWCSLPQDNRFVIVASTVRIRYSEHVLTTWKPHLHLALWNPFQALDIDAPCLITYGFSAQAIEAVAAWFAGDCSANTQVPVADFYA